MKDEPRRTTRLVCHGCGAEPAKDDLLPFRCPNARVDDDIDHVLRRRLMIEDASHESSRRIFLDDEPNPFVRYRSLFHSHQQALALGLADDDFVWLVRTIDRGIAEVDGGGFRETPLAPSSELNAALGRLEGSLWIKDETRNVSGSHKARHLMGILLWLEVTRRAGIGSSDVVKRLAIASCGNAALAAAVVAKAAHRDLDVFVPPDAHPNVVDRLTSLGSHLTVCERNDSVPGDPCVHRFHESLVEGALPFAVQGNENGLTIEGGMTLGWEMVSSLLRSGSRIDRLLVQVGGGALASSCFEAFREARALGLIDRVPRIHAVQTGGGYPLRRAWNRVVAMILDGEVPERRPVFPPSKGTTSEDESRAARLLRSQQTKRDDALHFAATHRSRFMWPWEKAPHSIAHGILDDETYDWLAIVEGMLETGGYPVVASEDDLQKANELAHAETAVDVEPTGSAGLAGLLRLLGDGVVRDDESVAVLFTGRVR